MIKIQHDTRVKIFVETLYFRVSALFNSAGSTLFLQYKQPKRKLTIILQPDL